MIVFYWYVLCIAILLSWHANDVVFGVPSQFWDTKELRYRNLNVPVQAKTRGQLFYTVIPRNRHT